MNFAFSLDEILELLPEAKASGAGGQPVTGIASLREAKPGDLSFLGNVRYGKDVAVSEASVILLPKDYEGEPKAGQVYVRHPQPSLALAVVCERIERRLIPRPPAGVHPSAVVDPSAEVDASASVGPLCVIEAGARIGAGAVLEAQVHVGREASIGAETRLCAHVTVYRYCIVGARCLLHAGCVIGADGFGFESTARGHHKVPQIGIVRICDDVEIGANSTIDRARFSETVVGRGTKIDNLVQIGHNCVIGEHCFLCAGVGISGSTKVGNFVVLAGQVGTVGHIEIGDFSQVGGQAGVSKSLPPKSLVSGTPAMPLMQERRVQALARRLPELFERVKQLENHFPSMKKADETERS